MSSYSLDVEVGGEWVGLDPAVLSDDANGMVLDFIDEQCRKLDAEARQA